MVAFKRGCHMPERAVYGFRGKILNMLLRAPFTVLPHGPSFHRTVCTLVMFTLGHLVFQLNEDEV